jgi:hypothetical protein
VVISNAFTALLFAGCSFFSESARTTPIKVTERLWLRFSVGQQRETGADWRVFGENFQEAAAQLMPYCDQAT